MRQILRREKCGEDRQMEFQVRFGPLPHQNMHKKQDIPMFFSNLLTSHCEGIVDRVGASVCYIVSMSKKFSQDTRTNLQSLLAY